MKFLEAWDWKEKELKVAEVGGWIKARPVRKAKSGSQRNVREQRLAVKNSVKGQAAINNDGQKNAREHKLAAKNSVKGQAALC